MHDLTVLVNTSDNFEDCWNAFFTLFAKFWPDCRSPVVLNTEKKQFDYPGLHIRCARVAADSDRQLTWSECLARCLDSIDTPYILYMQEDYFLEQPVQTELLERMLNHVRSGHADVVRIMECEGSGPWQPMAQDDLWQVIPSSRYFIGLQAGLWRKDVLRSWVRAHESPWQLEIFGSRRASRSGKVVACVNRDRFSGAGREILPYTPTGVISGQWAEHVVVDLFARHAIDVDFTRRGFHRRGVRIKPKAPIWRRLSDRIRSLV